MEAQMNQVLNNKKVQQNLDRDLADRTAAVYSNQRSSTASFSRSISCEAPSTSKKAYESEYCNLPAVLPASQLLSLAMNPNSASHSVATSKSINDAASGGDAMIPINQWCLGNEKLHTIRNSSHSHRVFASNLMIEMFSNDELTHLNCNVNGKVSKGNEINKENMIALDPVRIGNIRRTVLADVEGNKTIKMKYGNLVLIQ